jgi:hypothetical protein
MHPVLITAACVLNIPRGMQYNRADGVTTRFEEYPLFRRVTCSCSRSCLLGVNFHHHLGLSDSQQAVIQLVFILTGVAIMPKFTSFLVLFLSSLVIISSATPFTTPSFTDHSLVLQRRTTDPYFPPDPPSCPLCAADYPNIEHCAAACPVLANFSMVSPLSGGAFAFQVSPALPDHI